MCIIQIKRNYAFVVTVFLLHNVTGVIVTSKFPVWYRSLLWKHVYLSQISRALICLYIPQYSLKCDHLPMIQTQDFWLTSIHIKHVQHIAKRFTHSCTFLWFGTCQVSNTGHHGPVYSPHKGQWREALMFHLICVWINGWVNNGEAGDLRRYRAHYDVIGNTTITTVPVE